jgi:acyl-CoA thioesterase I
MRISRFLINPFEEVVRTNMPIIYRKFKSLLCLISVLSLGLIGISCQSTTEVKSSASRIEVSATPAGALTATKPEERPAIVAFGDSLTAGYGLVDREQAFTALLQRRLDEGGYRYQVIDAGVSGDTSAGGSRRIDWALRGNVKFLILELGGNDALRGQPVAEMKKNLALIIERAQSRGVTVILAGMEAPPNLGEEYTREFRQVFQDLANQYKLPFIPFVLEGVGGRPELNQPDGIHPNAEGEKIMTEHVWRTLEPLLQRNQI